MQRQPNAGPHEGSRPRFTPLHPTDPTIHPRGVRGDPRPRRPASRHYPTTPGQPPAPRAARAKASGPTNLAPRPTRSPPTPSTPTRPGPTRATRLKHGKVTAPQPVKDFAAMEAEEGAGACAGGSLGPSLGAARRGQTWAVPTSLRCASFSGPAQIRREIRSVATFSRRPSAAWGSLGVAQTTYEVSWMGPPRFELESIPPQGTRIPSYPTGPIFCGLRRSRWGGARRPKRDWYLVASGGVGRIAPGPPGF